MTLRPVVVPGGIGGRKWRDRRLLAELTARERLAPVGQLLIADETGELLETDRANVLAVIDGVLLTPPADGRLLPGTTRAEVMRAARRHGLKVGQKPLTLDEIARASEVFVTNAVVGALPVAAIDGCPVRYAPGPVAAMLAAALSAEPFDPRPVAVPGVSSASGEKPVTREPAAKGRPLVVLIDNYDSFTWNLAHLLSVVGARVEVVRNDELTAAEVVGGGPAGVVISPGPCAPAEAGISVGAVRSCATAGIPLLGICLGHQAIAAAFGAAIVRAPQPVHGQASAVAHDGRGVFAGLPSPLSATRYHSLLVDEPTLPPDLVISARAGALPMGVRHRSRPVEGVQFHPESVLTAFGAALLRNFVESTVRSKLHP